MQRMQNTRYPIIRGMAAHLPARVVTNQDLEKLVDTSEEWIVSRTGIRTRRIAAPGECASDLALEASRKAIVAAGMTPADITHILCATLTPDAYTPSTACMLQRKLGLAGLMAMDISAACSGFLYGLEMARSITTLHPQANVLLACSEILSGRINFADRATCVLFGDGAGAAVLSGPDAPAKPGNARLMDVIVKSDGRGGDFLTIKGGGSMRPYTLGEPVAEDFFIQMDGREVYKHAVRSMTEVSKEILDRNGLTMDDVDVFVSHQANLRIIEAVGKKLNIPEHKVFVNVDKYGNTSAASVPIALVEAAEAGLLRPGSLALVAAFGGGFTWGAALLRIQ